jgi:hypothetical protein
MAPKRKLKPIWSATETAADVIDPKMRSLTAAFEKMDIDTMAPPPIQRTPVGRKASPAPRIQRIPLTLGEEVQQNIEEWCLTHNLPIPPEYVGFGTKVDAEQQLQMKAELKWLEDADAAPAGEKPAFGTPAFWAWARKRKAEKDAEKAAKTSGS